MRVAAHAISGVKDASAASTVIGTASQAVPASQAPNGSAISQNASA